MSRRLSPVLLLLALLTSTLLQAQLQSPTLPKHPFIKYRANVLHYDSTSPSMRQLFDKWQRVANGDGGNLNIVHIGGSHVQAGSLTNTIRCNILGAYPNLVGPRGMIFPYSAAARCNNPADYRVHCPQKVELTRNVYKEYAYPLGLCGIAVTAADEFTEMDIVMSEPRVDYAVNRVVLLGHGEGGVVPRLRIDGHELYAAYIDNVSDRYIFNLPTPTDSFTIVLPCRPGDKFTVSGIYLDNRHPGFSYHSIGVNGAAVPDYLRCVKFVRDLRLLHPDVVVFGIGINDAVPANFDTAAFRQNYLRLIDSVRSINPDCAFIFITNNDSYRKTGRRRYSVNTNGALAREVFYRLAADCGGAVWDLFEVMGGLRSMDHWRKAGLARNDRVHFTAAGYQLVGDLFTGALFNAINKETSEP